MIAPKVYGITFAMYTEARLSGNSRVNGAYLVLQRKQ